MRCGAAETNDSFVNHIQNCAARWHVLKAAGTGTTAQPRHDLLEQRARKRLLGRRPRLSQRVTLVHAAARAADLLHCSGLQLAEARQCGAAAAADGGVRVAAAHDAGGDDGAVGLQDLA